MTLIPGSYARAAGLQSEINKVTITRVAGNEVQFRRAIDTYQKDLRYSVNQIGREQKQLKKSMRRYYKKLRQGKRERRQREAKEKEDSARLRLNARQFRDAEQAVRRRNVLVINHPDNPTAATPMIQGEEAETLGAAAAGMGPPGYTAAAERDPGGLSSALAESPDSGLGTESDDRSSAASTAVSLKEGALPAAGESEVSGGVKRKVFMTSNKTKLPYLKANRGGHKDRTQNDEQHKHQGEDSSSGEDDGALAQTSAEDIFLPVISEEAEDKERECGDHSKACPCETSHSQAPRYGKTSDLQAPSHIAERLPKPGSVAQLNTKTVSASTDAHISGSDAALNDDVHGQLFQSLDSTMNSRRLQRKTAGVSFGDLMKLQHTHTSGTKRLFKLVDKLASKHGIVDAPPPSSTTSASLDPRSNAKIKQRGDKLQSQMSGDMVKQAAVLYSMKYGYRDSDGAFSDDVAAPVFILSDVAKDLADGDEEIAEGLWSDSENASKFQVNVPATSIMPDSIKTDILDTTSRKLSVTSNRRESADITSAYFPDTMPHKLPEAPPGRRASTDVTSPHYTFEDAACPIFEGIASEGVALQPLDVYERRGSRARPPLSMTQLSEHATRLRDRNLRAPSPLGPGSQWPAAQASISEEESQPHSRLASVSRNSRPSQRLSPVPRGSRSLSRPRRESVSDQLQQRLSVPKDGGNMAWHSAFGRLKMLHTLFDLSQHFDKEG